MRPIRRKLTPGWALALACSLLAAPTLRADVTAPDPPPEETPIPKGVLIISAADFEGMPLPGVRFHVTLPDSKEPLAHTTNARGEIEIPEVDDPEAVTITLAEERYVNPAPQVVMNQLATISAWRLYRKDVSAMEREEREEFARAFQEVVRHSPEAELLANETARILAAFLTGGYRGSSVPSPMEPGKEGGPSGVLSVRLIDSRGAEQAGSLVQLYSYQPSTQTVSLVDYERTNEEGLAVFTELELGRYYRAEVLEDRELTARSTIVRLDTEDPRLLPTIILRPRSQILSGVVVDAQGVAAGTLVTAQRPSDGLMMTAATDSSGFFLLGPFASRNEVTLTFEQSTSDGVRAGVMRARPGEGELLVPLHVLAEEGPEG